MLAGDGSENFLEPHFDDFADKTEINGGGVALGLRRQLAADEHVFAMQSHPASAERVELGDDAGIDDGIEHLLDDADGLLVGDAQPVDELRLLPRVTHALGDRLAAAVDEHGVDAHGFEKDDIAQKALDDLLILHGTAAVFDDEKFAAEFLDEG